MLLPPSYKLTSVKLIAFVIIFIVITFTAYFLYNSFNENLSGDNIVNIFSIYTEYIFKIFGLFLVGNLVSKIRKKND